MITRELLLNIVTHMLLGVIFNLFHLMAHINQLLKFYCTPKNIFFANMTKNIGILLIHSHQTAIVVLAVVIFYLTV